MTTRANRKNRDDGIVTSCDMWFYPEAFIPPDVRRRHHGIMYFPRDKRPWRVVSGSPRDRGRVRTYLTALAAVRALQKREGCRLPTEALLLARAIVDDNPCCRVCGCTNERACRGGCAWAAPGLCTRCAINPTGHRTSGGAQRRRT